MNKLLNDEELSELDLYKNVELIKAINECNTYVQNGAITVMLDTDKNNKVHCVTRDVHALYEVMHYVNECSIPREALIAVIFNLFQFARDQQYKVDSNEFKRISFTVNILQQLLYDNTSFQIYSCKKKFVPSLDLNEKGVVVKRGNILYLLDRNAYRDKRDGHIFETNVLFDVVEGNWIYALDSEMSYFKREKLKLEDEIN